VVNVHAEQWEQALHDLRRYFFLRGQYALLWGAKAARAELLPVLSAQDRQLYALLQRLSEILARIN
jgi:hypothetical protein